MSEKDCRCPSTYDVGGEILVCERARGHSGLHRCLIEWGSDEEEDDDVQPEDHG